MCSLLVSPRKEMCLADCLLIDLSWGHRSLTLVCSQSDRGSRGTTARSSSDTSSNGGSPGRCGSKEGIAILGHQGRLPEEMPEPSYRKNKSFQGGVQVQTAACTPFFAQPRSEACHILGKATGSEMNPTGLTQGQPHWLGRWIQKILPRERCPRMGVTQMLEPIGQEGADPIEG